MKPSEFLHTEADLVRELALARKKIAALRADVLVRGVDWAHEGGEVRYSAFGREKLMALLKVPAPEDSAPNPPPPADLPADHPPRPGDVRDLVCVRTYPLNHRIIQARLGETLVRVRVRESAKFTPGMTGLRCRFVGADLWDLARPGPRAKGKW